MRSVFTIIFFLIITLPVEGQIKLDVVHPRSQGNTDTVSVERVDSIFVFGSINPTDGKVLVNGWEAKVWPNGAFMAFVPLKKDSMLFKIKVSTTESETLLCIPFKYVEKSVISAKKLEYKFPLLLEVSHPHAVVRYSNNFGVYYIFPVKGARAIADSISNNFFRLRLNEKEKVWIEDVFVTAQPDLPLKTLGRVLYLEVLDYPKEVIIQVPSKKFPLHRVVEQTHPSRLELWLYGLESHIDLIRNESNYVQEIRWEQLNSETLKLTIFLNSPQIWGYLAELDSIGNFILKIKKPPEPSLTKLKIALDPGHGGTDNGAIGPTRLLEKEANLAIALELAELLQNEGAKVFLTRSGDEQVELYQRLDKADSVAADFYISLHNNAHSDSVNPLIYHGMGVYYYQPKSLKLARFIHNRLLSTTKLPDDGFYYANFAAPRSTNMLSVLIETAFIIYPEEEILLKDTNFQRQTALGIYLGIKDFLKEAKREEKEYHSQ